MNAPAADVETPRELELLEQLASEKRSARIKAIVELAKLSKSRGVLRRVRELASDPDRETAMFAAQAVARISTRLGEPGPGASGEPLSRDALLTPIPAEIPKILERLRGSPGTIPTELRPAAGAFLARCGTTEDGPILASWLRDCQDGLAFSLLESLEAVAPAELTPLLPGLLASSHPLVRCHAIKMLQRIDPDEALAHLAEMCASRNAEERLAGVAESFFFPFARVREMLLTLLVEETDRDTLRAAETVIASNPEVETTMRLLSLIDVVPPAQKKIINALFKTVAASLAAAGLLAPAEADPKALLARWQRERLKRFLADLEVQLIGNPGRREAIGQWLSKNFTTPGVKEFVQKLALNPVAEDMARRLLSRGGPAPVARSAPSSTPLPADRSIGGPASPDGAKRTGLPSDVLPPAMSFPPGRALLPDRGACEEEQLSFLDTVVPESPEPLRQWVRDRARSAQDSIRPTALWVLTRLPALPEDVAIGQAAVDEVDQAIRIAGFRLLEQRDGAALASRLPELMGATEPGLRVRAVRLCFKQNLDLALARVTPLLNSDDPSLRAQGIGALILAPFERARGLLLERMGNERHPEIIRQILMILLSNPSQEMLDALDAFPPTTEPAIDLLVAQTRMDLFDLLLQLDLHRPAARVPVAISGPTAVAPTPPVNVTTPPVEKRDGRQVPPPAATKRYAVAEVREEIRRRETGWRSPTLPDAAKSRLGDGWKTLLGILAAVALLAVLPSLFLGTLPRGDGGSGGGDHPSRTGSGSAESPGGIATGFRMGILCRVTGTIEKLETDGRVRVKVGERTLLVKFATASFPALIGGETAEFELLPYRKLKSGEVLADGQRLDLLK